VQSHRLERNQRVRVKRLEHFCASRVNIYIPCIVHAQLFRFPFLFYLRFLVLLFNGDLFDAVPGDGVGVSLCRIINVFFGGEVGYRLVDSEREKIVETDDA